MKIESEEGRTRVGRRVDEEERKFDEDAIKWATEYLLFPFSDIT